MRPTRLVLLLTCFVALPVFLTFFSLFYSHPPQRLETEATTLSQKSGLRALFSFRTPTSLFPASAIISLTDDNTTFFLARPASFGPYLPADGLSGQLWVGSGFGDDSLGRGGAITGAEGELGCSDVPGWGDGKKSSSADKHSIKSGGKGMITLPKLNTKAPTSQNSQDQERRLDSTDSAGQSKQESAAARPSQDDGTDDYLHHPLLDSPLVQPGPGQPAKHDIAKDGRAPAHADIQSLQESAEIAGKVVLLSRGGCGFLEKVKWVQRRGGLALIVGDDTRGGPLVTMYAHGDTSNVTIPALFTSHTTAHLLSSLIPPDGVSDDTMVEDGPKAGLSEDRSKKAASKKKNEKKAKGSVAGTTFTSTFVPNKPTGTSRPSNVPGSSNHGSFQPVDPPKQEKVKGSWVRSLRSNLGLGGSSTTSNPQTDSRRPPSSGRINWILSEDWADEPLRASEKGGPSKTDKAGKKGKTALKAAQSAEFGDDFVIGVQDWRDPDLVDHGPKNSLEKWKSGVEAISAKSSTTWAAFASKQTSGIDPKNGKALAGGSITPGSGEYETPADQTSGWLTRLLSSNENDDGTRNKQKAQDMYRKKIAPHFVEDLEFEDEEDLGSFSDHEGLWVTMTPTTISTSPFFDTLLVLVVSPLVTLTVVYALLLLRSRIRRRRWRAPKSVVDRLPVRTYHTMSSSSHATTSQVASPMGSSAASPLLPSSPTSTKPRSRPRSRTTSGIAENVSASLDEAAARVLVTRAEKQPKKYSGKQVECVVCLEEYIDGQSRVMSLPCGHEFHAECM